MTQRILVAEDEMIVAFDLRETVEEAGFTVAGPYSGMSAAMSACAEAKPDLAILDIKLDDGVVYPLARRLTDEDVPIIFYSGRQDEGDIHARFPNATTLPKPCPPTEMLAAVHAILGEAPRI